MYRIVSLAAAAGSATGFSLRSLQPFKIFFPDAADPGTGSAGSFLQDRWKNILPRPGQPVALPPYCACVSSRIGTHHNPDPAAGTLTKEHTVDATTTTVNQLITCDGCGTLVPYGESLYVDGAGQLCTANCTAPIPECATGIEPPF